ncbi:ATP-binding cassette domain-containing protein [Chryseobacterium sp. GVT01B]|uniref:ATP-binding cassette domain-containing protein n=1 Tax=Chryseobacterium sp. GVT01B TaxID=2862675 RepID=UPI001CC17C13|nr:ATP-binding cassette domain-containing protein [Chryseobacterium sp. GVT01B]
MKLQLKDISYKIGDKIILNKINLEFENGLYALLGLNGTGKTSLINIISTLKQPSTGDFFYNDISVLNKPQSLRKDLGFMSQNLGLIQDFDIIQNLTYFGLLKGCEKKSLHNNILKIIKDFDLESYKKQKVKNLSGGIKQKISFALSIINSPNVLILDEPVNNLDYLEREKMYLLLKDISKTSIVILSTHLIDEISRFCDKKITISSGSASLENNINFQNK